MISRTETFNDVKIISTKTRGNYFPIIVTMQTNIPSETIIVFFDTTPIQHAYGCDLAFLLHVDLIPYQRNDNKDKRKTRSNQYYFEYFIIFLFY